MPAVIEESGREPTVSSDGVVTPASEAEMVALVRHYAAHTTRFGVTGLRTKYVSNEPILINTVNLSKILEFDRNNFALSVQSAYVPVNIVRASLGKEKRYLWVAGPGSVGGVIAAKSSVMPPVRDQILAMRVLLPTGDVVTLGAKTMKSVAGYDVSKLLLGSWGALGIILEVTFRLFPYPAPALRSAPACRIRSCLRTCTKKSRDAFDPMDLLSMRTSMLTETDIQAYPHGGHTKPAEGGAERSLQTFGDKFWL